MEDFIIQNAIEKVKENKIALLDADYIKYIVCSRRHKEILLEKKEDGVELHQKEEKIISLTKDYLSENIFGKISDPILFCFSGKSYNTFRNYVCFTKEYKAKRNYDENYEGESADSLKVMKYIMNNYVSLLFDDLEADDIVAALQDENTYIISKDKDLKQVPGLHYDFKTNKTYEITKEEAAYNLAYQLLIGDSTDNIPGLPKYGPKKAEAFLSAITKPRDYILHVLKLYQDNYGVFIGTDMFTENWNLVKMRENRGEYFQRKYQKMFDVKEYIKRNSLK